MFVGSFRLWISLTIMVVIGFATVLPAHAAPPSNDDFDSATVIAKSLPFTDTINTAEATTSPDDPSCYGNGPTVWYAFTPTENMQIVAHTFGSKYDTTLSVYTGASGSLDLITCHNDTHYIGMGWESMVLFDAVANQTYYFMVGSSDSGPGGPLVFTVDQFRPLTVDVQVGHTGFIDKHGNVLIHGTVTCSPKGYEIDVTGTMERTTGQRTTRGTFDVIHDGGYCEGEIPWEATVSPESGQFKPGQYGVFGEGIAFDFVLNEAVEFQFSATVRLKRSK